MKTLNAAETARELGLSLRRVHAMRSAGILRSIRDTPPYLFESEEVARVKGLERPQGRPKGWRKTK